MLIKKRINTFFSSLFQNMLFKINTVPLNFLLKMFPKMIKQQTAVFNINTFFKNQYIRLISEGSESTHTQKKNIKT